MAILKVAVALARIGNALVGDALAVVERFLREIDASVAVIDRQTTSLAIEAFNRFGKGRHPAALNMGDCFAYACARQNDLRLLCKGDDLPHIDISLA